MVILWVFWYIESVVTERMHKIDEQVLRYLSVELNALFPDKIFSLTMVHVSKDLSYAKVWVSAQNEAEKLVKLFNAKKYDLRSILAKKMATRKVPAINFVVDETEDKAEYIDKILASLEDK